MRPINFGNYKKSKFKHIYYLKIKNNILLLQWCTYYRLLCWYWFDVFIFIIWNNFELSYLLFLLFTK